MVGFFLQLNFENLSQQDVGTMEPSAIKNSAETVEDKYLDS
jgi:hypothetical protein